MEFSFATASRIRFGPGAAQAIPRLVPEDAKRLFVAVGATPYRFKFLLSLLESNGLEVTLHSVAGEPTVDTASKAAEAARASNPDAVLAVGGGSVLDLGKAVAALLTNRGPLLDYLEVVGKGRPLERAAAPFMAVPTTAGTGSEVTSNSVLGEPGSKVKASLRSPLMLPRWAVVDPELTRGLPPEIAAYTGMDAFIQCLEAYASPQASPLSDGLARQGLQRAARSLREVCGKAEASAQAREDICVASLCGGMALANAKLGAVHGFAGPLGGMLDAPHGAICAALLKPVLAANLKAMAARQPQRPSLAKYQDVAALLTGNPAAKPSYALAWIESLIDDLPLKPLAKLGFTSDQIDEAAEKAQRASSMKGNPVELTLHELKDILEEALAA